LRLIEQALTKARTRVEYAIKNQRPEWLAAQKEFDKAKLELDAATKNVLSKLKSRPDYKATSDAWAAADTKARQLAEDPKANQAELDALAQERAKHVVVLRGMEKEALENDPKVIELKGRMSDAKSKADGFKSEVDFAVRSDPEYLQWEQQYQASYQQVQAARQSLIEAQKQDAAARQAEIKAKAEEAKNRAKSGSGGGSRSGGY
jgi:hypothetical protein